MKVKDFNTDKGLYIFELNDFETAFHSHPAIEIIVALTGNFSISTPKITIYELNFAVVDANFQHKLMAENCEIQLIMIEHHNKLVKKVLSENEIYLTDGISYKKNAQKQLEIINQLIKITLADNNNLNEYDARIKKIIDYIDKNQIEYNFLKKIVNLSESRLSHLFKANVGVSIKKYLVWHRLKTTIELLLKNKDDLFTSLINSGFYDQPHFSKYFKSMLGIKPSTVYNSRTIQV